jgi:hypothetical protein
MDSFTQYLNEISENLKRGDATEHTHRKALETLLESIQPGVKATNEPSHIQVGAPDFNVRRNRLIIGHIECKDVGKDLDVEAKTDQLKRYRENLPNLILSDYIHFLWFREGKEVDRSHLARRDSQGKWKLDREELPRLRRLLENFLAVEPEEIGDSRTLAEVLARPARMVRDTIVGIFDREKDEGGLHNQLAAFRETLLPDLKPAGFADLYAQTIAYGLFAARTELDLPAKDFTWQNAFFHLPKANPFLEVLFKRLVEDVDERVEPWMEELALVLARSDMYGILQDFGKKTKQEDPVVHFYETFIGAYDPKMKKARGVYYTPQPVISYIVRSIDHLLKERFGKVRGLADENVYILDPACGTGSFLLEVLRLIHGRVPRAGWNDYVRKYLLHRLFGFELLMAPYIVSHLKLGLYLKETGFEFGKGERLGIFLTNTLEPDVAEQQHWPFARVIAEEGKHAQRVKKEEPIMVVLGNPPYSGHSANKVKWIEDRVRDYYSVDGAPLGERNPKWLQDDYVKFLRFAQWRIEQTGHGVVGMITNHGYLDNPTFRGMRQQLMKSFSEIYILDLHGNTKKREVCPDGSKDENVFDIQQGVAIGVFAKEETRGLNPLSMEEGGRKSAEVSHSELWGVREAKYAGLAGVDVASVEKTKLEPSTPFYLFVPQDTELLAEYERGWKITEVMPVNGVGMTTARDHIVIDFEEEPILNRARFFRDSELSDKEVCNRLGIPLKKGWSIKRARDLIKEEKNLKEFIEPVLYRPFDARLIFYHDSLVWRTVKQVMSHMLAGENLGLITVRQVAEGIFNHTYVTSTIIESRITLSNKGIAFLFPLYLYPVPKQLEHQEIHEVEPQGRRPNLATEFIADLESKLKLTFTPDGRGDLAKTFGPEDVFFYIYAILHSPTYRSRYAEFLKIDFPRAPLTSDRGLFGELVTKGGELVGLHLMESPKLNPAASGVVLEGPLEPGNEVEKVRYDEDRARVFINKKQFFSGVEQEVWSFHVGGYQVCHKWLKDRKGRKLNYDDITHYQKIVIALRETIALMGEIDRLLTPWPWGGAD